MISDYEPTIYHKVSTGELWNPTNIDQVDMPEHLINKRMEQTIKAAKSLLIKEGLISRDFRLILGVIQKE